MKNFIKKWKVILVINLFVVLLLLIVCLRQYIGINRFFILSFLGFFVPFLVYANILFVLYWVLKRKLQFLISFSILVFGYFMNDTFIKFNNSNNKEVADFSVMSFNAHGFSGFFKIDNPNVREDIVEYVLEENPDIVCFQEYNIEMSSMFKSYPHKYITPDTIDATPQAIFSKYPIVSKGTFDFENTINNAIYVDLKIKQDTVRVYNIHLESFRVRPGSLKREVPTNIFNRMSTAFQKQLEQAKLVKKHSLSVNYKTLICGDFNSTQYSNVYRILKGDLKDSFIEKGVGFGNTFDFRILPFRIDMILTDLEIVSHKNYNIELSDHEPIKASFRVK